MPPGRHKRTSDNGTVRAKQPCARQLPLPWSFSDNGALGVNDPGPAGPVAIFSIGHSNHDAETFLSLLAQHGVRTVADVRSAPYSRYVPHFSRDALTRLLESATIRYVWLGDLLGGRPDDAECYDADGRVDYAVIARQTWYEEGMHHLLELAAGSPTVMLCSEEDPRRCHRHRLLEPSLRARDVAVLHIRGDGSLETIVLATGVEVPSAQLAFAGFAA